MGDIMAKLREGQRVLAGEAILPAFKKDAFHCQFCQVFARQNWQTLTEPAEEIYLCRCFNCLGKSYWLFYAGSEVAPQQIYPRWKSAPPPHIEMPEDVTAD